MGDMTEGTDLEEKNEKFRKEKEHHRWQVRVDGDILVSIQDRAVTGCIPPGA